METKTIMKAPLKRAIEKINVAREGPGTDWSVNKSNNSGKRGPVDNANVSTSELTPSRIRIVQVRLRRLELNEENWSRSSSISGEGANGREEEDAGSEGARERRRPSPMVGAGVSGSER
jgi:hypothetical protein